MTNESLSWDLYRSFLAVLRTGSLSGAARSLGLTQPTIGRHIEAMEFALDVSLFIRSQTGFSPTETALRLQSHAESLETTVAALFREASTQSDAGTVRISASEIVGTEILPPVLTEIHTLYPNIKIELTLSSRIENLLTREADIAIRMAEPKQDALVARKLGEIAVGLHAHRRYLARNGTPTTPADLAQHAVIGYDKETEFVRNAKKKLISFSREDFALSTDNDIAQLAMIRAGYGIGFCQVGIASRDKNLVRVLPSQFNLKFGVWLVMHESLRLNTASKRIYSALASGLKF